jgi:hypothetical protein
MLRLLLGYIPLGQALWYVPPTEHFGYNPLHSQLSRNRRPPGWVRSSSHLRSRDVCYCSEVGLLRSAHECGLVWPRRRNAEEREVSAPLPRRDGIVYPHILVPIARRRGVQLTSWTEFPAAAAKSSCRTERTTNDARREEKRR